jgi:hypothetical protein
MEWASKLELNPALLDVIDAWMKDDRSPAMGYHLVKLLEDELHKIETELSDIEVSLSAIEKREG